MLAHGSPGDDVPNWAMRTAVRTLAQSEPFKLFHKINEGVRQARSMLEEQQTLIEDAKDVSTNTATVSDRPAGISQLGYACFWSEGGGVQEPPQVASTVSSVAVDSDNDAPSSMALSQSSDKAVHDGGMPPIEQPPIE